MPNTLPAALPVKRRGRRLQIAITLYLIGLIPVLLASAASAAGGDAEAPAAARPALWSSESSTAGFHLEVNTEPRVLPLDEFIRIDAPFGQSKWSSSGSGSAIVGTIYPGLSGTQGPGLFCDFSGGCPEGFPPSYPLSTTAAYPSNPDASTQDGAAVAHVGMDYVATSAGLSQPFAQSLEQLPVILQVGSAQSDTSQMFSADGTTLESAATTVLADVVIGGVVHIEELTVRAVARSAGDGVTDYTAENIFTGVTVDGHPVRIGSNGVELDTTATGVGPFADVKDGVNGYLAEHGLVIRAIEGSAVEDGGSVRAAARGVSVEYRIPVSGFPDIAIDPRFPIETGTVNRDYVGSLTLGLANATAFVSTGGFGFGFGGNPPELPPAPTVTPTATPAPQPTATTPIQPPAQPYVPAPRVPAPIQPPIQTEQPPVAAPPAAPPAQPAAAAMSPLVLGSDAADTLAVLYGGFGAAAAAAIGGSEILRRLMSP